MTKPKAHPRQRGRKSSAALSIVMPADATARPSPPLPEPDPPGHLSERSAGFWREVVREYVLAAHELELLRGCCEAMDLCDKAGETVKREGLIVTGGNGEPKAHPMIAVERNARNTFARYLRMLDLKPDEPERPKPYWTPDGAA